MITLSQIKQANSQWFSKGNKQFFGDVRYWVYSDSDKDLYLVRSSYAWSDMCGGSRKLKYYINTVDKGTLKIGSLVSYQGLALSFNTLAEAKAYIKG